MLDLGFVSAILADNSFEEVVDFAAALFAAAPLLQLNFFVQVLFVHLLHAFA